MADHLAFLSVEGDEYSPSSPDEEAAAALMMAATAGGSSGSVGATSGVVVGAMASAAVSSAPLPSIPLNPSYAETMAALTEAAEHGDLKAVTRWLPKLLQLREQDFAASLAIPLQAAIRGRNAAIVAFLLLYPADVNAVLLPSDGKRRTLLHLASELGQEAIAESLLCAGADVNAVDADGLAPLHIAALGNFSNLCLTLLDHGARPSVQTTTKAHETPLQLAERMGAGQCAALLAECAEHYLAISSHDAHSASSQHSSAAGGGGVLSANGSASVTRTESYSTEASRLFAELDSFPKDVVPMVSMEQLKVEVPAITEGKAGIFYRADCLVPEADGQAVTRMVALKALRPGFKQHQLSLLMREAAAMSQARYPCIVDCMGSCLWEGIPAMIIEYAPFGCLESFIADNSVSYSYPQAVSALHGVVEAVDYLFHQLGTIHRNIKTRAILVFSHPADRTRPWLIKLGSFGSAIYAKDAVAAKGIPPAASLPFVAPELMTDGVSSEHSEVYSLGMVLYELLHRSAPWKGWSRAHIVKAVASGTRPFFSPFIPSPLREIVTRAWCAPETRSSLQSLLSTLSSFVDPQMPREIAGILSRPEVYRAAKNEGSIEQMQFASGPYKGGVLLALVVANYCVQVMHFAANSPATLICTLSGHLDRVTDLEFSLARSIREGGEDQLSHFHDTVATSSADGSIRLWSLPDGHQLTQLDTQSLPKKIFFLDKTLISAQDTCLQAWQDQACVCTLPLNSTEGHVLAYCIPNDQTLLMCKETGPSRFSLLKAVLVLDKGKPSLAMEALPLPNTHPASGRAACCAFSKRGDAVACGLENRTVVVWSLKTASALVVDLTCLPSTVTLFSGTHGYLAIGTCDGRITLYNIATQSFANTAPLQHPLNTAITACSMDGRGLAVAYQDGSFAVFDSWRLQSEPR